MSEEPEVRCYPMLHYRFGAYEPPDDALTVLGSVGLMLCRREVAPGRATLGVRVTTQVESDTDTLRSDQDSSGTRDLLPLGQRQVPSGQRNHSR